MGNLISPKRDRERGNMANIKGPNHSFDEAYWYQDAYNDEEPLDDLRASISEEIIIDDQDIEDIYEAQEELDNINKVIKQRGW